jgi:hypothetical protein
MKATIALFANLLIAAGAYAGPQYSDGPFTPQEAAVMSAVWPRIREAARYEDIDWRSVGLSRPPGDREARSLTAENWSRLREAGSFEDIDWRTTTGYRGYGGYGEDRARDRGRRYRDAEPRYRDSDDRRSDDRYGRYDGYAGRAGPYTAAEADALAAVWPEIREAQSYEDIDWRSVGLRRPPGDSEARALTARYWRELREAADFYDIDWRATTGYGGR